MIALTLVVAALTLVLSEAGGPSGRRRATALPILRAKVHRTSPPPRERCIVASLSQGVEPQAQQRINANVIAAAVFQSEYPEDDAARTAIALTEDGVYVFDVSRRGPHWELGNLLASCHRALARAWIPRDWTRFISWAQVRFNLSVPLIADEELTRTFKLSLARFFSHEWLDGVKVINLLLQDTADSAQRIR